MLGTLALSVAAIVGGALATYVYDPDARPLARLFAGAATGYAVVALAAFLAAWLAGFGAVAIGVAYATGLAPLLLLLSARSRGALVADLRAIRLSAAGFVAKPTTTGALAVAFGAAFVVAVWLIFDRVVLDLPDGLYTGFVNNLGDLPLHFQITTSFAFTGNVPPEDPTYLGSTFAYPYMTDFLSALFVEVGADLRTALLIPNLVLAVSLTGLLYRWTMDLTSDRLAAVLAPVLLFLGASLGWLKLIGDARTGEAGILGALASLDHDVTIGGDPLFRFGNTLTTLFIPQRSLLLGLPVAILVLALLWRHLRDQGDDTTAGEPGAGGLRATLWRHRSMLAAGLFAGMLPLLHAYTFVAVMVTAFLHGLVFRQWRNGRWVGWAIFVIAAAVIAIPELIWSTAGSLANPTSFIGLQLGWDRGDANPVLFWIANTGAFIPLLVLSFLLDRTVGDGDGDGDGEPLLPSRVVLYYLPFAVWFVVPNVIRFAPWIWDNIKLLLIWYVASVPFVALTIASLLRGGRLGRLAGIGLLASLTLGGVVDLSRVVVQHTEYRLFDTDGIAFADKIRSDIPERAVVLHAPTYNPPVFLTGRRSVLGYTGHIWSRGLDFTVRERDIRAIYAGDATAADLLRQYGVQFVEVTPLERAMMPVNDGFFDGLRLVDDQGEYRLYAVSGS